MIESIVSGLLVAAVTGLAFLSYKHHDGYKLISKPLKLLAWAVFLAANAYSLGFTSGKYSKNEEMVFSLGWLTVGLIAFWVFIGLLDFLPLLTKGSDSRHSK